MRNKNKTKVNNSCRTGDLGVVDSKLTEIT